MNSIRLSVVSRASAYRPAQVSASIVQPPESMAIIGSECQSAFTAWPRSTASASPRATAAYRSTTDNVATAESGAQSRNGGAGVRSPVT